MYNTLAVSQHFDLVFPPLKDRVEALCLRSLDRTPPPGYELTAHLDGFIDSAFDCTFTPALFEGLKRLDVKLLSLDIGPACREVRLEGFWVPASPVLPPEEILEAGKARMRAIRAGWPGPVSLENLDFHPGGAYDHVCEPSFIHRALEAWDAGLTLDIGHLHVTCHHTGLDPREFVRRLPLERLVEVHLSHSEGGDDAHALPEDADYALLDYVLGLKRPRYVKLEYYEDADKIVEGTRRLAGFLASRRATAAP